MTIKLTIKGQEVELTPDEAKEIFNQLSELLPIGREIVSRPVYVPTPPIYYEPYIPHWSPFTTWC